MQSHVKRAVRAVLGVGAALEAVVLVGAVLWALRPDGDIGECTDVCSGDRSVEALFGSVALTVLVAFGVACALLGMLAGGAAWRAAREAPRPMPAWLVWTAAAAGLALGAAAVAALI